MSGLPATVMLTLSLPQHCTPTNSFLSNISSVFHTCIPTPLALLSTLFGICSIGAWLFAQLPQVFKNFALKSASGLSILFLIEWLLGDVANLVGGLLTGQASWQVVIAAYYVSVDIILLSQYLWYTHLQPWRNLRLDESKSDSPSGDGDDSIEASPVLSSPDGSYTADIIREGQVQNGTTKGPESLKGNFRTGRSHQSDLGVYSREKWAAMAADQPTPAVHSTPRVQMPSKRALFLTSTLCAVAANASPLYTTNSNQPIESQVSDPLMVIGQITSWLCTCLYLGSRIPQIYKNQQRRSTSGLSPALFIAAFCGNIFYSSSLLANPLAWSSYPPNGHHGWAGPEGSDRATWVRLATPFWLGAFGVLALDAIIGVQFLRFGEGTEGKQMAAVPDGRGRRRRWQKVNGWLRGWISSPGPKPKRSSGDDGEVRLLLHKAAGQDSEYGAT
jgi:solute carrier family 66 (lysosomal lysine-arginine transporter), member 1